MSPETPAAAQQEIQTRYEKAAAMVSALNMNAYAEGARTWVMSIPARPDYDPDLVIGASLGDVPTLLAQLAAAESRLGEATRALRTIADWPFNIQGDCVADARKLAERALSEVGAAPSQTQNADVCKGCGNHVGLCECPRATGRKGKHIKRNGVTPSAPDTTQLPTGVRAEEK